LKHRRKQPIVFLSYWATFDRNCAVAGRSSIATVCLLLSIHVLDTVMHQRLKSSQATYWKQTLTYHGGKSFYDP